jgi:hypothetical protein
MIPTSDLPDAASAPSPASAVVAALPSRRRKLLFWALNLWLVFHVTAVIVAPASVGPSSDVIRSAWNVFRPYLQVLYLNHGYHFFAPEPGQSTLVGFVAERAGGAVVEGRIPNRSIVPRLLYHRHFMLSEHMITGPPELQKLWYESYARHLGHKYRARHVSLSRVTHYLPTMEIVRGGVRLDDPGSYTEEPLGVYPCDGF